MSSTILKLTDKTEEIVRALNSAIDGRHKQGIRIQYEKLLLLEEVFESLLPETFFKKAFADFSRHVYFVGYYLEKDDFDGMKHNAEDLQVRYLPAIKTKIYDFIKSIPDKDKPHCFKTGVSCSKDITPNPNQVFLAMPFRKKFEDIYKHGIVPVLEKYGLTSWKADQEPSNIDIMCKICEHLQESRYAIVNITGWNANVLLKLGLAYGLGKTVVLINDKGSTVPVDLKGMEYLEYESSEDVRIELEGLLLDKVN